MDRGRTTVRSQGPTTGAPGDAWPEPAAPGPDQPGSDLPDSDLPDSALPESVPPELAHHDRAVLRTVPDLDRIPTKLCPEGHPNDPSGTTCRVCERTFDAAAELIHMAPVALARLIFEDGTAVDLTGDLTIGRCPLTTEPPSTGDTLTVTGPQVSRRHLMVWARGWRLWVQDCDSTNGTFIARAGERGRRKVPMDEPATLRVGDTLHFGSRQALVIDARPR